MAGLTTRSRGSRLGRGFTLIELMITIALAAILVTIGIPSYNSFILGQRVKTATYDLSAAVLIARSEAIKRNVDIALKPSATGWVGGWRVAIASSDLTLESYPAVNNLTVATSPDALVSVTFGRDGRPTFSPALSAGESKAKLTVTGGSNNRCVKIDLTGMPSTDNGACS